MAAKLTLRRGISFTNPSISEPFFNTDSNTLEVGYGTTTGEHITLVKIGENTGDVSFTGDITGSNLSLSGNANIAGNITLGGDIFLGDGDNTTDKINVNASLSGSLVPDTDGVYDLGSTSFRYNNIHVLSASIENLTVGGSGILSSSQQISDYNTFLEIEGMNVVSGSSQINLTQTTNYITGIKTRLDAETVISGSSQVQIDSVTGFTPFSSSVDGRLDSLETSGLDVTDRLDSIEATTESFDGRLSNIELTTQSFDGRLDNIESFTSSYFTDSASVDSRLDTIEGPLSTSLDNRLDLLESFSSSLDDTFVTTTELHTATSSLSASLTITDDDFEDRINTLETTFSSSVDSRLDAQESFSESLDNSYEEKASLTHTLFSGSSQVNADTITNFDSNVKTKLDLDNVVSSSVQVTISDTTGYSDFSASIATTDEGQNDRLDSIESYTASVDSLYEEISSGTHTLVSGSSQIQIDSVTGFTAHSSSVDSRLDSLEGDSHTHSNKTQLDVINQDLSNTSNVTFNDITASGNVIVSGDLTVLGTATEIQTSELVIKDKLITIASGSTNSAEADGSGIEIDGAGKSIIWDDATQSFILNAKVSSSVGFKGDGSELTGVTADSVHYDNVTNKPTLFSGSSQVDYPFISNIPSGIVSESSQVNADTIVNFDSNVKEKLNSDSVVSGSNGDQLTASLDSRYLEINGDNVFSGSSQVNADTIVNFDSNVKDKMNLDNVISGSVQITNGSGILSSSNENFTTFSSSVDTRLGDIETTFSSSVDSRLDFIEGDFSQSVDSRLDLQEAFSESLDNEFLNTNGDGVVSGSSQVDVTQTTNIETIATTGSNVFIGNQTITGSLSISGSDIEIESPITSSNTIEASFFIGDGSQLENVVATEITYENITGLPNGLVSQSSQIDVTQTQNYGSIRQYDNTDNTTHLNSLNVVSGSTYSSPSQGTLRATINGANSDVDLGLQSTDTPTFNSLTASNLPEHSTDIYDAVFKGTSGEFGYRTLASAAFYHVSASISDGNPEVIGNAGAVKDYIDEQLLIIGAGDITKVTAGDGISGGADSGEAIITLDTGSQHFIDGVTGIAPTLPSGLISGSDQVTASLDTRYVNAIGDTISGDLVISGDLTVNGTTTTINTTNLNVEDNIIELNYGGSATEGGLLVKDVTGGSTISGSLLWDGTNDVWKAGILGSESPLLTDASVLSSLPSGLVSGSSQIDVTQTTNYSSINQYSDSKVKLKLDADGVISSSAQITITESQISDLSHYTDSDVKLKLDNDNVHSGSYLGTATTSQLDEGSNLYYTDLRVKEKLNAEGVVSGSVLRNLDGTGILSSSNENFTDFSSSVDSRFGALSTDYNDLQNVPSGILSSSTQISGYNTFLEINGDNVISGSSQVQIDSVTGFTTFSSSVDSRLDSLEGVTSENPLTFDDTATVDLIRTGDVITANVIGGVVSGSSQITKTLQEVTDAGASTSNAIHITNTTTSAAKTTGALVVDGGLGVGGSITANLVQVYSATPKMMVTNNDSTIVDGQTVGSYQFRHTDSDGGGNGGIFSIDLVATADFEGLNNTPAEYQFDTAIRVDGLVTASAFYGDGSNLTGVTSYTDSDNTDHLNSLGVVSGSTQVNADIITNFDSNVKDKLNVDGVISGSDQLTGSLVDLTSDQTISGTKTFTDIVVNGTGSFAYFISTESELNVIGQSFIVLNNDTPTERYAGLAVYDSGSADTTASFQFDGQTNDWFYEYSDDGGVTTDHGAALFGPAYATKGAPTYPTNNRIQKGNGGHHLLDSNITDDGSTITLGSNTNISGQLNFVGASIATEAGTLGITATSGISLLTSGGGDGVTIAANGNTTIYGALALESIPVAASATSALVNNSGVVSQRTLGSNAFNSTSYLTDEVDTLETVTGRGASTATAISITNATASTSITTGALVVTGGIGTSGDVFAGGDVVAYASSDERLKDNILPIENPLQKINQIGGYSFDWNVEKQDIYKGKDYGVIAQEIEEILPELVDTRETGYKAVKYDKLVSLLIEGIKELSHEVNELKQQINK